MDNVTLYPGLNMGQNSGVGSKFIVFGSKTLLKRRLGKAKKRLKDKLCLFFSFKIALQVRPYFVCYLLIFVAWAWSHSWTAAPSPCQYPEEEEKHKLGQPFLSLDY